MYNECTGCNFVCILHPYCNVHIKDLKEKEVFNFNERIVEKFFMMGLKWMMLEVSLALHFASDLYHVIDLSDMQNKV